MRCRQFTASAALLFCCLATAPQYAWSEAPCSVSQVGETCHSDEDCQGEGAICSIAKICVCHPNYIEFPGNNGRPGRCERAPDTVGSNCQKPKSYCKPPLVCEGNTQCTCVRGTVHSGSCVASSNYGDHCDDNDDCTSPFMYCSKQSGTCDCVEGTTYNGAGKCDADSSCPDGAASSGKSCRILASARSDAFTNIANSGTQLDDCDSGEYCVSDGVSPFGFCCSASCPHGYPAESSFSCDPVIKNSCPADTHFCHRVVGPAFAVSLCCRRPCQEPTPIYADGTCYERSYLFGPCQADVQCSGGVGMGCNNGQCQCHDGYVPADSGTGECVRDCGGNIAAEDRCLGSGAVAGEPCQTDDQCSVQNSMCFNGACRCQCGFALVNGDCISLSSITTTMAPGQQTTKGFADLFGSLFGKFGIGG